jgi:hypothetical protein
LERLLLDRLGEYQECRDIRVAIIEPAELAPHLANWGPAFISPGKEPVPQVAWKIVREMGSEFELAE